MGIVVDIPQSGLDYVLYGDRSNLVTSYIHNQLQALPPSLNDFGRRIYSSLQDSYNYLSDTLMKNAVISELRNCNLVMADNYYAELLTFNQLQEATLTMQRWVMAHPQVRELYLEQNIDGYTPTYVNLDGKVTGDAEYNYRRVMNNVLIPGDEQWTVNHYIDELLPGDRELEIYEQHMVLNTWEAIDWMLKSGYDFTCRSTEPVKFNK